MMKNAKQARIRAFFDEWADLIGANPDAETLAHVGITPAAWAAIRRGKAPFVSVASWRLAHFRRHGDLSSLAGHQWRDFSLAGGELIIPGVRRPLAPAELRSWWAQLSELHALRSQVQQLQREAERAESRAEAAEQRAWYYRSQLRSESRLALLLADA